MRSQFSGRSRADTGYISPIRERGREKLDDERSIAIRVNGFSDRARLDYGRISLRLDEIWVRFASGSIDPRAKRERERERHTPDGARNHTELVAVGEYPFPLTSSYSVPLPLRRVLSHLSVEQPCVCDLFLSPHFGGLCFDSSVFYASFFFLPLPTPPFLRDAIPLAGHRTLARRLNRSLCGRKNINKHWTSLLRRNSTLQMLATKLAQSDL